MTAAMEPSARSLQYLPSLAHARYLYSPPLPAMRFPWCARLEPAGFLACPARSWSESVRLVRSRHPVSLRARPESRFYPGCPPAVRGTPLLAPGVNDRADGDCGQWVGLALASDG